MFSNLSIKFKLITGFALIAVLFFGATIYANQRISDNALLTATVDRIHADTTFQTARTEDTFNQIVYDVLGVATTPPIQGIMRARDAEDNFDALGSSTYEQWRTRLETIFVGIENSKKHYLQIRYLNELGEEMVRVDFKDGVAVAIPEEELQYKGDRYYFTETMQKKVGEIYVSALDLNREGTPPEVEIPYKPVIRYGTPVADETGEKRGIIIVNVLAQDIIATLGSHADKHTNVLIDQDGYYLLHTDDSKEWGSPRDLGHEANFATDWPDLYIPITQRANDTILTDTDIVSFSRVQLSSTEADRYLVLIERTPIENALAGTISFNQTIRKIGVILFLFLLLFYYVFVGNLLKPLHELASTAVALGTGELKKRATVASHDEVGKVSAAFNTMAERLAGSYQQLEDRVKEKTQELQDTLKQTEEQNSNLENTKKAMINILEDVEEEKKKVESLAGDLEKFKLATDNTSDAVIIADKNAITIYANEAIEEVTGYTREEAMGVQCGKLWGGNMGTQFYDEMWNTLTKDKKAFDGEVINVRKNGEELRALVSLAPILNAQGDIQFFVEIMRDVTEDYRQKQDLQKFALAIESTSDHVIITDTDGMILYANPAVGSITGYSPKEILGKKAGSKELWGGLMEPEFYKKLWHTIKVEKKPFSGEVKNKRKNGQEYIAYATISPVVNNKGDVEFFVGIERDITKEKQIDQAKTEFVSLASHQLRTPLSSINWYAEMLLAGDAGNLNDEQKQYLDEIYQGNQRMVALVNALLNVSRLELGTFMVEPEPTNVKEVAESVVNELKPMIEKKKLVVTSSLSDDLPIIQADPKLLRIVIQNFMSNAVKYTSENGKVNLSVALEKKGATVHKKKIAADHILITVADTGYGIPQHQQDRLFTKLFRADNVKEKDTEGTGLGMYIAKQIIDHADGMVWFESEEDKGTTFYIAIPTNGMKKKEGTRQLS